MSTRKTKRSGKPRRAKTSRSVREDGAPLSIRNSGLEVWLYDDANLATIREIGAMPGGMGGAPARLDELMRQGLLAGYSLASDDDLEIAVHVGEPFTAEELAVARWLEPQTAFLRLPSGKLRVESNDASRIGPEQATEKGGLTKVPPGEYRLTLYRIDHEALFREGLAWQGPQEVVLLTPGGTALDAVDDLLPHQSRRDTDWVGKYRIDGTKAEALVWFQGSWDWFVLNLDAPAMEKLGVRTGTYIRTHVPDAGITLVSVFADSWEDGSRLPLPAGVTLEEYGYAAVKSWDEWGGVPALWCRRETSKTRIEHQHHNIWIPAVVEVLDAPPAAPAGRGFTPIDLAGKTYFDSGFLTLVLCDVLPEAEDMDELPLAEALNLLGAKLGEMGFAPQGDYTWHEQIRAKSVEGSCRFYTGLPDTFAVIIVGDGNFELIFLSERHDGSWVVNGFADELNRRIMRPGPNGLPVPHPRIQFSTRDESVEEIFAAHEESLHTLETPPLPAPSDGQGCLTAFERFLDVVAA